MSADISRDHPLVWPDESPEALPGYRMAGTVVRRPGMTEEDAKRITERRARQAAEDRASVIRGRSARVARRTSPIAIAAIICAFVLPIVGFALGIVGAIKLDSDSTDGGQGLSIAAVILAPIMGVITAVVLFS